MGTPTLRTNALTTLEALKQLLGIDETDTSQDGVLIQLINRASASIENALGRKLRRSTYTERVKGTGSQYLLVENYPIVAVEEIKQAGEIIDPGLYDITVRGNAGVIYKDDGWTYYGFPRRRHDRQPEHHRALHGGLYPAVGGDRRSACRSSGRPGGTGAGNGAVHLREAGERRQRRSESLLHQRRPLGMVRRDPIELAGHHQSIQAGVAMSSVTRTHDDWTPWYERTKAELARLAGAEIHVGILGSADSELLRIAAVHEFGATIHPRNAKNLAIPLRPDMKGKSPRDVEGAFFLDNGENRFICRKKGKKGDQLDFLFLLLPSVTIPERSFIRASYDGNKDVLAKACENAVRRLILGELTADQACHNIGTAAVAIVKRYMRTVQPPKSSLTLASAPGKTAPLVQTGRLRDSITYEVTGL